MAKPVPYEFVFDYLPANIIVKKMFGMHYIYLGKRIMFILRKQDAQSELNGIWIATSKEHHPSLKKDIRELGSFFIDKEERHGNWLFLPDDTEDFEQPAIKVCEMISHGDPRIGKLTEKAPI
ncbi:MAG: hypothetical protein JWR54_3488 [Mucilaginibacter sp.]|nr:hypothetical protein [Mucilaginibacter sp.]